MSVESFGIIESTLREGEQFVGASFSTQDKIRVAEALDRFGVEYIELTSPAASTQSYEDCKALAGLGLKAKIVTHVRCRMPDAELAVQAGVAGIDVVIGTSAVLRQFSDGKDVPTIMRTARDVVSYIRDEGLEVRVSTEDSFRSDVDDLMSLYQEVDALGVDRVGIADTVGIATPLQVHGLVSAVKNQVKCGIEFHGHNDSGCAIANAYCALEAGATHVDASVLGIGERNGIASLGGLIARIYAIDRSLVSKYRLTMLPELDNMIADMVGVDIPFNNYITGIASFTHKAGVYAKAVLNDPETYEILAPNDFGLSRYISIAHRLTGRGAIEARAEQLNLAIPPDELRVATNHAERLAEDKPLGLDDVDAILRSWISEHIDRNE
jgi:homocitrate synthase